MRAALVVLVVLVGCGGDPPAAPSCAPGAASHCRCDAGTVGVRVCLDAGAWEPCRGC